MKWCLLLIIPVVMGMAAAQNPAPKVRILESPGHGLILQLYRESDKPKFPTLISASDAAALQQLSLVLTNSSGRDILGLTIRWIVQDASGKQQIIDHRTDSFFTVRRPVLAANSAVIIAPKLILPTAEAVFITAGSNNALINELQGSSTIDVYLDAVIFEGGQVIGQDRSQTVAGIMARKTAANSVIKAISDARQKGVDPSAVLSQLANTYARQTDSLGVWTARIAELLMRSSNLDRALATLSDLPAPAFWR